MNDNGTQQGNYNNNGATGINALAAGTSATAAGAGSVAVGAGADSSAANTVALGLNTVANNAGDVAVGSNSVTAAANPTASGTVGGVTYNYAGATPSSVVSVGAPGAERQITNVAAGQVTATSTDAINGSQLYATNTALDSLSTTMSSSSSAISSLSTGITSLSTGLSSTDSTLASLSTSTSTGISTANSSITSLSTSTSTAINAAKTHYYSVNDNGTQQGNYNNDGATGVNALAAGTNATAAGASAVAVGDGANGSAAGSVALGQNAVASHAGDVALGSNSVTAAANPTASGTVGGVTYNYAGTNPTSVVSVGAPGAERQITNVAAGQVTATSTDAINGSQLYATNAAIDSLSTSTSTGDRFVVDLDVDRHLDGEQRDHVAVHVNLDRHQLVVHRPELHR
ncbi:hypothetical protein BGV51_26380 [Burkholderia ubonensis]|nr:hypothetical protein BGV51_26380 [Burkholderia ubonensis]